MQSRITMFEGLMMIMIAMFFDIVQFFVGLLDRGTISGWIINPFFVLPIGFWLFFSKGVMPRRFLVGSGAGLVPFLNMTPFIKTATIIGVIMLVNNPQLAGLAANKGLKTPTAKPGGEKRGLFSASGTTHFNAS